MVSDVLVLTFLKAFDYVSNRFVSDDIFERNQKVLFIDLESIKKDWRGDIEKCIENRREVFVVP